MQIIIIYKYSTFTQEPNLTKKTKSQPGIISPKGSRPYDIHTDMKLPYKRRVF